MSRGIINIIIQGEGGGGLNWRCNYSPPYSPLSCIPCIRLWLPCICKSLLSHTHLTFMSFPCIFEERGACPAVPSVSNGCLKSIHIMYYLHNRSSSYNFIFRTCRLLQVSDCCLLYLHLIHQTKYINMLRERDCPSII